MTFIKCPKCGRQISNENNFCPGCGCNVRGEMMKDLSKVPLILSVVYVICVLIYANDYLWEACGIVMFLVGIGLVALLSAGHKLNKRIQNYLFAILYLIGSVVIIFGYNIARIDLEGGFFSPYTYSGTLGVFLAVFQIVSVASIILLGLAIGLPQISKILISTMLFISGIIGMSFHIYRKIHLSKRYALTYDTFYIWLGIVTLCFFLVGAVYLLTKHYSEES